MSCKFKDKCMGYPDSCDMCGRHRRKKDNYFVSKELKYYSEDWLFRVGALT